MGRISSAVRPGRCAALLLVLAGLLIADSFLRDRGRFDYRLIEAVRAVDGPGISASMHALDLATRTPFMLAAIAVLFVFLVVRHDWLGASVVAILPLALPVALALGELVERRAPDPSLISSAPPATAAFLRRVRRWRDSGEVGGTRISERDDTRGPSAIRTPPGRPIGSGIHPLRKPASYARGQQGRPC